MAIRKSEMTTSARPDHVPVSASLPMQTSRPIPTMSMIFGKKKDTVAKSWSDLWDEGEESEQEELAFNDRRSQKSRRWSDDSQPQLTVRPGVLAEAKSHSSINARRNPEPKTLPRQKCIGSPNENEPLGFRGHHQKASAGKNIDKWAALGNKRRNFQPAKERQTPSVATKRRSMTMGWRREGNHVQRESRGGRPWLDQDWRTQRKEEVSDRYADEDDSEWVGVFNLHL